MKITMAQGSGGKATSELIATIFAKNFYNPVLSRMEDSAVVPGAATIALTTDSFVVTPLFFPGGDIGKLSVCGTVNDLSMSGAVPKYLTCGFILEEGADTEELEKIVVSMAQTAREAGVSIVAGDTKVVEGKGGMYINTAGVGFLPNGCTVSSANCVPGDAVLLSGNLGDHHAAILSARMQISNTITSDCAPLNGLVSALMEHKLRVKAMRDVTRGGLATVLNEFACASQCCISLREEQIPVTEQVRGFCGILGLDPLYMGNEGKMVAVVAKEDAQKALQAMRSSRYGENAAIIGEVTEGEAETLLLKTSLGGTRILGELYGEGLPRIC
jgi:hydrogenase expression/formation protein HypE